MLKHFANTLIPGREFFFNCVYLGKKTPNPFFSMQGKRNLSDVCNVSCGECFPAFHLYRCRANAPYM